MSHTPPPWIVQPSDERTHTELAEVWGGWSIVAPIDRETDMWEDKANAYLIAAAPELLAQCKHILATEHSQELCPNECDTCQGLRALIAKAEGRENDSYLWNDPDPFDFTGKNAQIARLEHEVERLRKQRDELLGICRAIVIHTQTTELLAQAIRNLAVKAEGTGQLHFKPASSAPVETHRVEALADPMHQLAAAPLYDPSRDKTTPLADLMRQKHAAGECGMLLCPECKEEEEAAGRLLDGRTWDEFPMAQERA